MKTARILFIIARTHGYHAHLLADPDMTRLLGARTLIEVNDMLLRSDYASQLSRISSAELTALRLERVFYEKLSDRLFSMLSVTSGRLNALLEAYNTRIEVANLKLVVRAIHGQNALHDDELLKVPRKYVNVNFPAMLTVKTIQEFADLLKESPYETIAESISAYERLADPALLEARLDKIYYENLWSTIDKLPDAKKIKALLGTEIDLRNLELILALKYMKLEPSAIEENVIELMYRLRESEISRLVHAYIEDLPKMTVWPPYSELLREAIELARDGKTAEMQSIFLRYLYAYAQQVSLKNPNGLVYVFSYLLLCQREARNLTTLAIGKQMKIIDEKLNGLLFL